MSTERMVVDETIADAFVAKLARVRWACRSATRARGRSCWAWWSTPARSSAATRWRERRSGDEDEAICIAGVTAAGLQSG